MTKRYMQLAYFQSGNSPPFNMISIFVEFLMISAFCNSFKLPQTFLKTHTPPYIKLLNMKIDAVIPVDAQVPSPVLKQPKAIQGFLFDMDGTMVDSDEIHFQAYRDTILHLTPEFNNGNPINRMWYNSWISGNSNEKITERLYPGMAMSKQEKIWEYKEALYRKMSTKIIPLGGLLPLLSWCDNVQMKSIVVTNSPRPDAEHTMKVLGLHQKFGSDVVIGNECTRPKPYPEPYTEGLKRLNLNSELCIAFEDSINGCKSACAAGLFTVGIMTALDEKTLLEAGAGLCIKDFSDVRLWDLLNSRTATTFQMHSAE